MKYEQSINQRERILATKASHGYDEVFGEFSSLPILDYGGKGVTVSKFDDGDYEITTVHPTLDETFIIYKVPPEVGLLIEYMKKMAEKSYADGIKKATKIFLNHLGVEIDE